MRIEAAACFIGKSSHQQRLSLWLVESHHLEVMSEARIQETFANSAKTVRIFPAADVEVGRANVAPLKLEFVQCPICCRPFLSLVKGGPPENA